MPPTVAALAAFVLDARARAAVVAETPYLAERIMSGDTPPEFWTQYDKLLKSDAGQSLFALTATEYRRMSLGELVADATDRETVILKSAGFTP